MYIQRITHTAVALFMAIAVYGQYFSKMRIDRHDYADTIPIEIRRGRILVPVEIDGRIHRFVFDTGCSSGLLFTRTAIHTKRKFGFLLISDAAGHTRLTGRHRIPRMRIGNLSVTNYPVTITPASSVMNMEYDCVDNAGCIGMDIVSKGGAVKIDIANKRLILTDRLDFFSGETGYHWPLRIDQRVPYFMVNAGDEKARWCMFDSGFSSFLNVREKDIGTGIDTIGVGTGVTNGGIYGYQSKRRVYMLRMDSISIGDCVFRHIVTDVQRGNSFVLGSLLLKYGTLVLDYKRREAIFQPHHSEGHRVEVGNRYMDYGLLYSDSLMRVGIVWEGSEAWQKGLRSGFHLTHIDGIEVTHDPCAYMQIDTSKDHELTFLGSDSTEVKIVRRATTF